MSLIQNFRNNSDPDKKNDAGYIQNLATQLPPVPRPPSAPTQDAPVAPPPPETVKPAGNDVMAQGSPVQPFAAGSGESPLVAEVAAPQQTNAAPLANGASSWEQLTVGAPNFLEQVVNNRGDSSQPVMDNATFKPDAAGAEFQTGAQIKAEQEAEVERLIEESNQGNAEAIAQAEASSIQFVPTVYEGGYDSENAFAVVNEGRSARDRLWGSSVSTQQNIEQSLNEYVAPVQERTDPQQFRPDSTKDFNDNAALGSGGVGDGDGNINILKDDWGDAGTGGIGGTVYTLGAAPNTVKGVILDSLNFVQRAASDNKVIAGISNALGNAAQQLGIQQNLLSNDDSRQWAAEAIMKGRQYDFSGYKEPNNPFGLRQREANLRWYKDPNWYIGMALDTVLDPLSLITAGVSPRLIAQGSRALKITGRTLQVIDNPLGEAFGVINRARPKTQRTIPNRGTPTVLQPNNAPTKIQGNANTVIQPNKVPTGGSTTRVQTQGLGIGGTPTKLQAPPSQVVSGSATVNLSGSPRQVVTPSKPSTGFGVQVPKRQAQAPKTTGVTAAQIQARMGRIPKNSPEWRQLNQQLKTIQSGGTVQSMAPQMPVVQSNPRYAPNYKPPTVSEAEQVLAGLKPGTLEYEVAAEQLRAARLGVVSQQVNPTWVPNGSQTLAPTQIQAPVLNNFSNLAPTQIRPPAIGFGNLAPTQLAKNPRKLKPEEIVNNIRSANTRLQAVTKIQEVVPDNLVVALRENVNELVKRAELTDSVITRDLLPTPTPTVILGEFVEATPPIQRVVNSLTGDVIEADVVQRLLPPARERLLPPAKSSTSLVDTALNNARQARAALRELYTTPELRDVIKVAGLQAPVQKLLPEVSYDRLTRDVRNILADGSVQRLVSNTTDNTQAVLEQQARPTIAALYSNRLAAANDIEVGALIEGVNTPGVVYDATEVVNAALVREEFAMDMAESLRELRQVAYDLALKTEEDGALDQLDAVIKRVNTYDAMQEGIEQTLKDTWDEINKVSESLRVPKVHVEYTPTKDVDPTFFKPVSRVRNPRTERRVAGWAAATPPPPKPVVPEVDQRFLTGEMTASELAQVISDVKPGTIVNAQTVTKTKRLLSDVIELMKILPDNNGVPLVDPNAKYGVRTWADVKKRLLSRGIEDPAYYRLLEREGAPIPIEAIKEGQVRIRTGRSTPTQPAPQAVVNLKLPEVAPEIKAAAEINDAVEPIRVKVENAKTELGIKDVPNEPVEQLVVTTEAIEDLAVWVKVGEDAVRVQEQLLDNTVAKLEETADIGRKLLDDPTPSVVVQDVGKFVERQQRAASQLQELMSYNSPSRFVGALENFDESLAARIANGTLSDSIDFKNNRSGFAGLINDYFIEDSTGWFNDTVFAAFSRGWSLMSDAQRQWLVDNIPAKRIKNLAQRAKLQLSSLPTPKRLGSDFNWNDGLEFGEIIVKAEVVPAEVIEAVQEAAVRTTSELDVAQFQVRRINNALEGVDGKGWTRDSIYERIADLTNPEVAAKFMDGVPEGKLSAGRVSELVERARNIDHTEWLSGDWKPEPLKVARKTKAKPEVNAKADEFLEAVINKRTEGSLSATRKLALLTVSDKLSDDIQNIIVNRRIPELKERLSAAYAATNNVSVDEGLRFAEAFIKKELSGTTTDARALSLFNVPDSLERAIDDIILDRSVIAEPLKEAYRLATTTTELPKDVLYHGTRVDNWNAKHDPLVGSSRSEFGQALYLTKNYDAAVDSAGSSVAKNAPLVKGRTFNTPSVRGVSVTNAKLLDGSLPVNATVREAAFRAVSQVMNNVNEFAVDDVVDTLDELLSRGAANEDAWHLVERALVKNGIKSEDVLSDVSRTMNARLRSRGIHGISSKDTVALFDTSVVKELSNSPVKIPDTPEAVAAARHNVESRVSASQPRNASARVNHLEATAKLQAEVLETSKEALLDDVERLSNEVSKAADTIAELKQAVTDTKAKKRAASQAKAQRTNKKLNDTLGKPSTDPCQF